MLYTCHKLSPRYTAVRLARAVLIASLSAAPLIACTRIAVYGGSGGHYGVSVSRNFEVLPEQKLGTAPHAGVYVLWLEPENGRDRDLYVAELKQGEPLGFRKSSEGKLLAVAGATEKELPLDHYVWRTLPAPGKQRGEVIFRTSHTQIGIGTGW